jgi:hypothetical protein
MKLSISEILKKTNELETDPEKVEFLRKCTSEPLKNIIRYMYDTENIKFLIPSTPPPWKKNGLVDVRGMLYNEARRLKIFVAGGGYDNLNKIKREMLFITLLESIDDNDAELLTQMIAQKQMNNISPGVIREAFPGLIPDTITGPLPPVLELEKIEKKTLDKPLEKTYTKKVNKAVGAKK